MAMYEVAVVGVGAVGEEMLRVLSEHRFPAKNVRVLARSDRSIEVDGREYQVQATTPDAFDGVDVALFAGTEGEKGAAVTYGEEAVRRGAVVIDNGADFRMRPDVPLVVPEVNGETLRSHKGIVANPNCSTAQLVMALKPLHDYGKLTRVLISTYQAVSGAGGSGPVELASQTKAIASGQPIPPASTFATQIVQNVIPQIGGFDDRGYTSEEMKLVNETRKILGDSSIAITPMITARVPVVLGHSEAVYVETEKPISPDKARELWASFPGIKVVDDIHSGDPAAAWPTPLMAAGNDLTYIGRVRADISRPGGLVFWVVSDNLRKGAASNAVQIAEKMVELDLLRKERKRPGHA